MDSLNTSRRAFLKCGLAGAGAAVVSSSVAMEADAMPLTSGLRRSVPYRVGSWLPADQDRLNVWLANLSSAAKANPKTLHPVIVEFKELIEKNPQIYMYFHQMFEELPGDQRYERDPRGDPQVHDYKSMLAMMNQVLTTAPQFDATGLVGFPINAILDWPMGTPGGFAAFLNEKVNGAFKKILNAWSEFLASPESRDVLSTDPVNGWFGRDAMAAMPNFADDFQCDPSQPHYGFNSWDDFFTRRFRPGRRPVASPNDSRVIANACESAPYRIARKVKAMDRFWIKSQPYSLCHMFGGDAVHAEFVGGTIYQAFLSALSYHRWHSPIDGTVERAWLIDGSYYSQTPSVGYDPASPNESQGYITEVAARAVILIRADNPAIGLMAFLAVGMAEVSTCEITVSVGQKLAKGDELGMFHFGGSTHCLIFGPQVELEFDLHGQSAGLEAGNIHLGAAIARVMP